MSAQTDTAAITNLLATFTERAAALGVDVHRAATAQDAAPIIAGLARETGAAVTLRSAELAAANPELMTAVAALDVALRPAGDPAESNDAPLGLSLAHLAVAETASVLLAESTLEDRGIGLLVATQLVVCPTDRLVHSLDDAARTFRTLATQAGGAYATLVTGPSRTADIERTLTVGVQGPARLVVLFIDQPG